MNRTILFILFYSLLVKLQGQINWDFTYGDSTTTDEGWCIKQTFDGGFILGGMANYQALLLKTDPEGILEWGQTYESAEVIKNVRQSSDGGFIATGYSTDPDPPWLEDLWVVKTDGSGNIQWEQTFGTSNKNDWGEDILESYDGCIVVTGTQNDDGDNAKAMLRKYSSDGELMWSNIFSSSNYNEGISLIETSDNNFVFVGFSGTSHGAYKHFMVKADAEGNQIWKKRFGNNTQQSLNSVCEAPEGGYVATGYCNNYEDVYIVKYSMDGDQEWDWVIDASDSHDWDTDQANDIIPASNGGYYILGSTSVYPGSAGQDDLWLLKTDEDGDTLWTEIIGGEYWDYGQSIIELDNGELILAGTTDSYTDYPNNPYDTDAWLISYTPEIMNVIDADLGSYSDYKLYTAYPNPFNLATTLRYDLPVDGLVNITIYDMKGRVVRTLLNREQTAGTILIQWNATNDAGTPASAGLYLYVIQTDDFWQTKKMVLLK